MSRSVLYLVIATLVIATGVIGYLYWQSRQGGVDIQIDKSGVSIDGN